MTYQRRDWLFCYSRFLMDNTRPKPLVLWEERSAAKEHVWRLLLAHQVYSTEVWPCCIPCSRILVNRLITTALSTPEARAQFQAYMAETVYNPADQFLPTCGEPTRRGEGSPEDDFNMPKQGDDWIWTPHWPPTVLLWREWARQVPSAGPGWPSGRSGGFPLGRSTFKCILGRWGGKRLLWPLFYLLLK